MEKKSKAKRELSPERSEGEKTIDFVVEEAGCEKSTLTKNLPEETKLSASYLIDLLKDLGQVRHNAPEEYEIRYAFIYGHPL